MKKTIKLGKLTYNGIGLWLPIRSDGEERGMLKHEITEVAN